MTPTSRPPALLLDASVLDRLLTPDLCFDAAREAFAALADGAAAAPMPMHLAVAGGGFHAKAASFAAEAASGVVALKFNANFPANPTRHGLPTIQGAVLLCSAADGRLLAVLDSSVLTARRTAAATALAAHHLARRDARALALIGCGAQAWPHLQALARVLPLDAVALHDHDRGAAEALAARAAAALGVSAACVADPAAAAQGADVIVTCTPSTTPLLDETMVAPGSFVAAVGADHPHKHEIAPALMARASIVVDSLAQCAAMGDLHHALACGAVRAEQVQAELGEVVTGRRPGRTDATSITLFDSTGIGIQDAACAARAWARALETGAGQRWAIDGGG